MPLRGRHRALLDLMDSPGFVFEHFDVMGLEHLAARGSANEDFDLAELFLATVETEAFLAP